MSITVVGSIAYDAVKTPFGERERQLGGTAVHFSLVASQFTNVNAVGPIGGDFDKADLELLESRGVNTEDVVRIPDGKTFFWRGHYEFDMAIAHTDDTQLNVFGDFSPDLSATARSADVLFLGNIRPELQLDVLQQCDNPRFVALDSMNYYIEGSKDALIKVIKEVDCVILNDAELRQLTELPSMFRAAQRIMEWGPAAVVIKQGEYGSALYTRAGFFGLPSYPLESVCDPTGAGDSFAGGFMGTIASHPDEEISDGLLRQAMAYGTTMASFNVEEFGCERTARLTKEEINQRYTALREMTHFADVSLAVEA